MFFFKIQWKTLVDLLISNFLREPHYIWEHRPTALFTHTLKGLWGVDIETLLTDTLFSPSILCDLSPSNKIIKITSELIKVNSLNAKDTLSCSLMQVILKSPRSRTSYNLGQYLWHLDRPLSISVVTMTISVDCCSHTIC